MTTLYPDAVYKPLGAQTQPKLVNPSCIVLHTMGGYLQGTDTLFRRNGYTGTESHFGIGGSWDGINDGVVWQWQDLDYTADAQYDGNAYGISIETSDGAIANVSWTPKQVAAITDLIVFLCRQYTIPAVLMNTPTTRGIGYHSLFKAQWNRDGHLCPGVVRIEQLVNTIIPQVAEILSSGEEMPAQLFHCVDPSKDNRIGCIGPQGAWWVRNIITVNTLCQTRQVVTDKNSQPIYVTKTPDEMEALIGPH